MALILIKKLGTRINKNGKKHSYALFLCTFCNEEVEKRLDHGKVCQSCGCKKGELTSISNTGKKRTDEQRQKISELKKGKPLSEKNRKGISEAHKGKKQTEEYKQKMRDIMKGRNSGKDNPNYGNGDKVKGNKNPNWTNGSSFEPYSPEFNKDKKQQILERDNYECQNPNCKKLHDKLHIHHIDYDKKNNGLDNLITLCHSCHAKTNSKKNRNYWTSFYLRIIKNKCL